MLKPWGIGAWAAEAELAEEEEKRAAAEAAAASAAAPPPIAAAFPSLDESRTVKPKKKKALTLAEFTTGQSIHAGSKSRFISDSPGLTAGEILMLPKAPRDRSGEEDPYAGAGLGGGFRDYGMGGGGGGSDRDRPTRRYDQERESTGFLRDRDDAPSRADESSDWGSSKKHVFPGPGGASYQKGSGSDDRAERAPPPPSRADEVDNWGSMKKSMPLPLVDPRATVRRQQPSDEIRQHSRADEVDNWASVKKIHPPAPPSLNTSVHETARMHSRADEVENWSFSKVTLNNEAPVRSPLQEERGGSWGRKSVNQLYGTDETHSSSQEERGGSWGRKSVGQVHGTEETRKVLVLTPTDPTVGNLPPDDNAMGASRKSRLNPFGSAKPREDVLAERGVYPNESVMRESGSRPSSSRNESVTKESGSRPSSSHSIIRPESPQVSTDSSVRPKPKVNPFGNAKPREVILQEKGKDWRKIDFELEHRGVDRPETEEEKALKEEIKELVELGKQEAEGGFKNIDGADETDVLTISERLRRKEKELELLTRSLDDKVRFSQKAIDKPGIRLVRNDFGRSFDFPERPMSLPGSRPASLSGSRPGSRSGRSDTGKNYDILERPGSQSGQRNLESSENPESQSWSFESGRNRGRIEGGRNRGQVEGGRGTFQRGGSWAGSNESSRSFNSLQRSRQSANSMLAPEMGSFSEYSPQEAAPILDAWNKPNGGVRNRMDWRDQSRSVNDRAGMRRF